MGQVGRRNEEQCKLRSHPIISLSNQPSVPRTAFKLMLFKGAMLKSERVGLHLKPPEKGSAEPPKLRA